MMNPDELLAFLDAELDELDQRMTDCTRFDEHEYFILAYHTETILDFAPELMR